MLFQSPITPQTKASLFHNKFYKVQIDNSYSIQQIQSMYSILLLEYLFLYLKTIALIYSSLVW